MLLLIFSVLLTLLSVSAYVFLRSKYDYWKKRGVPCPKPTLLFGNFGDYITMKKNAGMVVDDICQMFPDEPLVGAYLATEPAIIVKDPELLKIVTTKEFYYFSARELPDHTHREPFTRNLFHESGDYWKVARQNLTPIFSSAKMKKMFPLIANCNKDLDKLLDEQTRGSGVIELKRFMARYTMDCVGSCVFGVDTNLLSENDTSNPFRMIADKMFDFSKSHVFKQVFRSIYPNIFYAFGNAIISKQVIDFFQNLILKVANERGYEPSARNDFVDLMLTMKKSKYLEGDAMKNAVLNDSDKTKVSIVIDDNFLTAQSVVFFAAGFDTTATTLCFNLYELAKHQEAQKKAREEVLAYLQKSNDKLDYDCSTDLPYVDACFSETMRLYPVLGMVPREAIEDYQMPSGVVIEKGTRVYLPTLYFHMNPEYFPEPTKYRPERFYGDEKNNVKPFTYFPFGEGPRICIGMRFAKMVMIASMVTILKRYRFELAEGMPETVELDPMFISPVAKGGINLKFTAI